MSKKKADPKMQKEWDELLESEASKRWLQASSEDVLEKVRKGEFLPMSAPDEDAQDETANLK